MSLDSLQRAWQRTGQLPCDPRADLQKARARAAALDRDVRRRDFRESIVALVMLPLFGWLALTAPTRLSALGAVIVAGACVAIPLRLHLVRRRPADPAMAVADTLRAELDAVRSQERLLRSVAWWYFGPLGVGVLLYVIGGARSALFKVAYLLGISALYAFLTYMNRAVARHQLRPLAADLERSIHQLMDHTGGDDE